MPSIFTRLRCEIALMAACCASVRLRRGYLPMLIPRRLIASVRTSPVGLVRPQFKVVLLHLLGCCCWCQRRDVRLAPDVGEQVPLRPDAPHDSTGCDGLTLAAALDEPAANQRRPVPLDRCSVFRLHPVSFRIGTGPRVLTGLVLAGA